MATRAEAVETAVTPAVAARARVKAATVVDKEEAMVVVAMGEVTVVEGKEVVKAAGGA